MYAVNQTAKQSYSKYLTFNTIPSLAVDLNNSKPNLIQIQIQKRHVSNFHHTFNLSLLCNLPYWQQIIKLLRKLSHPVWIRWIGFLSFLSSSFSFVGVLLMSHALSIIEYQTLMLDYDWYEWMLLLVLRFANGTQAIRKQGDSGRNWI